VILSGLIVAAAIVWAVSRLTRPAAVPADDPRVALDVLSLLAPANGAVRDDPRAVLLWQPLADIVRRLYPKACARLDEAAGGTFPFSVAEIEDAHARWTADWLSWERSHDAACKLKAATVEHELGEARSTAYGRARLEAVEREKLEQYQRRYEEYTRVARALQALVRK
jgi:hypothetical protein